MLDIAIWILLIFGFLVGLKRGMILQIIHLTGFIIAFIVAKVYYAELASKLTLWIPYPNIGDETVKTFFQNGNLEDAYYRAIAFVIIFVAVKIVLHIIGSMLDFVANLPILKQLNVWAGGILGFLEIYLLLFIVLYIAALIPLEAIQNGINNSGMAKMMIEHTPVLSEQIKNLWLEYVG
ncbi:CvpA family protein [Bacillaceae bacterium Marseille-Q3522]|nr:CvpA family protein [Bacillaceae bacterium Marseille-Q3522]